MECEMQRHTGGNRYIKNDIYMEEKRRGVVLDAPDDVAPPATPVTTSPEIVFVRKRERSLDV